MANGNIETSIDRLKQYVEQQGQTTLSQTAKALAISEDNAEKIALLLEESGLIEVKYGLSGAWLTSKKLKEPVTIPGYEPEGQDLGLEKEITDSESMLEFMEREIIRRINNAEEFITCLEMKKELSETEMRRASEEVHRVNDKMQQFHQHLENIIRKENEFEQKMVWFKKRIDALSEKAPKKQNVFLQALGAIASIGKKPARVPASIQSAGNATEQSQITNIQENKPGPLQAPEAPSQKTTAAQPVPAITPKTAPGAIENQPAQKKTSGAARARARVLLARKRLAAALRLSHKKRRNPHLHGTNRT